ncbi:endo-1,5-alpha-L-arabinosidase [Lindgomyces ingoldianus]|uniref:Endo-1,5-alpha-L-arabinosidase n=1 Tax=Lindgomyces ingoldianus TaxID=673940 RepID=A0ACB6QNU7_9PLEO|nr:endo-1,5-alpha-L-arabinosidase [Lindgomyces ingoldianus]KAF2468689.1 endo-1,5-alpha-L-arabinosidase [Lindgomyces ingoldianus]
MLNSFLSFTTLSALLATAITKPIDPREAASWPDPEPCTGNCSYIHDPSVLRRKDGTWFRFSTLGNIAIATAPALTGPWTYQGAMLPSGSKINVVKNQQLWAPDVSNIDGTYYAYYSVSHSGLQTSDIGVATSSSLNVGSWTDHGSVGVPKSGNYNLIDPNFFRECANCQNYWSFGSAWNDVYQTSLNPDFLTWSGVTPAQKLFNSTVPKGQNYPSITEGSFLFWWPVSGTKYYYMFFSSGACCNAGTALAPPGDEYKIMVCRATSPTGPFVDQAGKSCLKENGGTLVLGTHGENVYAPGGQGVVFDQSVGRVALYYHYANPKIGYGFEKFLFGFNYLEFASGWPVVTS